VSRPEVTAHIALGANLGEPAQALRDALSALGAVPDIRVVRASSLYRTAPVDSSGPDYLNAVVEIATTLTAPALLDALQAIEQQAGRQRPYRNAPRTLDLDLLRFGDSRIHSPRLTVPHPRMGVPLAEIAPTVVSAAQLQAVAAQRIDKLD
jgi:2-amino-4-hydroxy-6-hydroxymethyldihydropteridine diphosphokinase